jgi:hypothetical protein
MKKLTDVWWNDEFMFLRTGNCVSKNILTLLLFYFSNFPLIKWSCTYQLKYGIIKLEMSFNNFELIYNRMVDNAK